MDISQNELNNALEGIRQAKKQLQWVVFAESVAKTLTRAHYDSEQLTASITALTKSRERLAGEVDDLKATVTQLQKEEAAAHKATDAAKIAEASAKHDAEKAYKEVEKLAKTEYDAKLAGLAKELTVLQLAHRQEVAKLDAEIASKHQALSELKAELEDLKKKWL